MCKWCSHITSFDVETLSQNMLRRQRYLITFSPIAVNLNLVPKDRAERISVCWDSKSYGLGEPGSKSGRYKRFFFFFQTQPDRLSRPPSLPYDGYRRPLLGLKWPVYEIGHSLPSSIKVKNEWSHISSTLICLPFIGMDFNFSSFLGF